MGSRVHSIITDGSNGIVIDIECHLSNNLPNIVIVGFANKAVDEARERLRGAFASSRLKLPRKRIIINLAPADIPKTDSGFDLAIAVAIMQASDLISVTLSHDQAFIGELGLDGSIRSVRGIIGKLLAGRAAGIRTFFVPAANLEQARLVPDIDIVAISHLQHLYCYLNGSPVPDVPIVASPSNDNMPVTNEAVTIQFSEIAGQEQAKRCLEIAAAGGHNTLLSGPPGTGKSMLARALPSLLPALECEEILEVTQLHSLSGLQYEKIITQRPFRAPHHSASHVALVGGGALSRPGEISLAHRGILFMDELPEFKRSSLEALRQPLEDRTITISRARSRVDYPASFMLIATANPCPCGYYGTQGDCTCLPHHITTYQHKLSGPILDRIDLFSQVHEVDHEHLLTQSAVPKNDKAIKDRVRHARQLQAARFQSATTLNADMTNRDTKRHAKLESPAAALLNTAASRLNISARAYMRTIKVARTIADLAQSTRITSQHISEALAYRHTQSRE